MTVSTNHHPGELAAARGRLSIARARVAAQQSLVDDLCRTGRDPRQARRALAEMKLLAELFDDCLVQFQTNEQ